MADFYAFFKLAGVATIRVDASSDLDAARIDPEPFAILRAIRDGDAHGVVVDEVETELINLVPSWQAEEFARPIPPPAIPPHDSHSIYDPQGPFALDINISARTAYLICAPTRALALPRAMEALEDVRRLGFAALDPDEVPYAFAHVRAVRAAEPEMVEPGAAPEVD